MNTGFKTLAIAMVCSALAVFAVGCKNRPSNPNITGQWTGVGTFFSNCEIPQCRWSGSFEIDIVEAEDHTVTGEMNFSLLLEEELIAGSNCQSRLVADNLPITGRTDQDLFIFTDPVNIEWLLAIKEDRMEGRVGNAQLDCQEYKSDNVALLKLILGEQIGGDATSTWRVVDRCDDNENVNYRFFDRDNNVAWPDSPEVFTTSGFDATNFNTFTCQRGAKICIGAAIENVGTQLGLGIDNTQACLACCRFCEESEISFFPLECQPITDILEQ